MLDYKFTISVIRAGAVALVSLVVGMVAAVFLGISAARAGWNGDLVFRLAYLVITPLACYMFWQQGKE